MQVHDASRTSVHFDTIGPVELFPETGKRENSDDETLHELDFCAQYRTYLSFFWTFFLN